MPQKTPLVSPEILEMRDKISPALQTVKVDETYENRPIVEYESTQQIFAHALGQPDLAKPTGFDLITSNGGQNGRSVVTPADISGASAKETFKILAKTLGVDAVQVGGQTWLDRAQLGKNLKAIAEEIATAPDKASIDAAIENFWAARDAEIQSASGKPVKGVR